MEHGRSYLLTLYHVYEPFVKRTAAYIPSQMTDVIRFI